MNSNNQSPPSDETIINNQPSKPKLTYFNAQGRAEIIRLIFIVAEVPFEDFRFRRPPYAMDDFEQFKKQNYLPFGQVPLLEIDGIYLAQSQAIVRYIARKYGLLGDNDLENALADMIQCGAEDLRQKFTSALLNNNGEAELQLIKFKNDICYNWGNHFEKFLSKNGGIWFIGTKMTYADLAVYDTLSSILWKIPNAFDNFPLIQQHKERIEAIPSIQDWHSKRPQVPF